MVRGCSRNCSLKAYESSNVVRRRQKRNKRPYSDPVGPFVIVRHEAELQRQLEPYLWRVSVVPDGRVATDCLSVRTVAAFSAERVETVPIGILVTPSSEDHTVPVERAVDGIQYDGADAAGVAHGLAPISNAAISRRNSFGIGLSERRRSASGSAWRRVRPQGQAELMAASYSSSSAYSSAQLLLRGSARRSAGARLVMWFSLWSRDRTSIRSMPLR